MQQLMPPSNITCPLLLKTSALLWGVGGLMMGFPLAGMYYNNRFTARRGLKMGIASSLFFSVASVAYGWAFLPPCRDYNRRFYEGSEIF